MKKPTTYNEWRKLYQEEAYWLGSSAATYFRCRMAKGPAWIAGKAMRRLVTRARRIGRIKAHLQATSDVQERRPR